MAKNLSKRQSNKNFEINELLVLKVLLLLLVISVVYLFVSGVVKQGTAGKYPEPPQPTYDLRDGESNDTSETISQ